MEDVTACLLEVTCNWTEWIREHCREKLVGRSVLMGTSHRAGAQLEQQRVCFHSAMFETASVQDG